VWEDEDEDNQILLDLRLVKRSTRQILSLKGKMLMVTWGTMGAVNRKEKLKWYFHNSEMTKYRVRVSWAAQHRECARGGGPKLNNGATPNGLKPYENGESAKPSEERGIDRSGQWGGTRVGKKTGKIFHALGVKQADKQGGFAPEDAPVPGPLCTT